MKKIILCVCLILTVLFLYAVNSDTKTLEIEAYLPGNYNGGSNPDSPSPYNYLIVRDIYGGNIIGENSESQKIDIGRGLNLFSDEYVDAFRVEYVTNNLAPVSITVEINPFTLYDSETNSYSTTEILQTSVKSVAGFSMPGLAEFVRQVEIGQVETGWYCEKENNVSAPTTLVETRGAQLYIKLDDKQIYSSVNSSDLNFASEANISNAGEQNVFKFSYKLYKPDKGWSIIYERPCDVGHLVKRKDHRKYRYEYKSSYQPASEDDFVSSDGVQMITNYIDYSIKINDDIPTASEKNLEYRMNVKVTLNSV